MVEPLKILTYSTLYPNRVRPQHGIFVENRLRRITDTGEVSADVIAPVPWFPFKQDIFGHYGSLAKIEKAGQRFGLSVDYPRYLTIPKIGMSVAPELLFRGTLNRVKQAVKNSGAVLIDAHYFYPDGVAAARIGEALGLPVVITARGSDINLIAEYAGPRKQIVDAANRAAAVIVISLALQDRMIELGVDPRRIYVLRNGVDLDKFKPMPINNAVAVSGIEKPTMLAVGNVLSSKGQDIAIRALKLVEELDLVIVGDGPDRPAFQQLASELGLSDRVRFVGRIPQNDLKHWFSAAEFSVLASMREGMPNVLLESVACDTPVIASNVGGAPEIVASAVAGRLMADRSPEALAAAIQDLRASPPKTGMTRSWAENFGWEPTIKGQISLYRDIIG